jgi:hypothetical protein
MAEERRGMASLESSLDQSGFAVQGDGHFACRFNNESVDLLADVL